jgi:hypothetical protein
LGLRRREAEDEAMEQKTSVARILIPLAVLSGCHDYKRECTVACTAAHGTAAVQADPVCGPVDEWGNEKCGGACDCSLANGSVSRLFVDKDPGKVLVEGRR